MIKRFICRLKKNECGATMVEFALVVMVLLTVIFGIIEFGWIFNGYITLTGAVREGVRLAVVMENDDIEMIKSAVINHAKVLKLESSDIIIEPEIAVYDQEREIRVVKDLDLLIFPGSVSLEARATMRHERNGDND